MSFYFFFKKILNKNLGVKKNSEFGFNKKLIILKRLRKKNKSFFFNQVYSRRNIGLNKIFYSCFRKTKIISYVLNNYRNYKQSRKLKNFLSFKLKNGLSKNYSKYFLYYKKKKFQKFFRNKTYNLSIYKNVLSSLAVKDFLFINYKRISKQFFSYKFKNIYQIRANTHRSLYLSTEQSNFLLDKKINVLLYTYPYSFLLNELEIFQKQEDNLYSKTEFLSNNNFLNISLPYQKERPFKNFGYKNMLYTNAMYYKYFLSIKLKNIKIQFNNFYKSLLNLNSLIFFFDVKDKIEYKFKKFNKNNLLFSDLLKKNNNKFIKNNRVKPTLNFYKNYNFISKLSFKIRIKNSVIQNSFVRIFRNFKVGINFKKVSGYLGFFRKYFYKLKNQNNFYKFYMSKNYIINGLEGIKFLKKNLDNKKNLFSNYVYTEFKIGLSYFKFYFSSFYKIQNLYGNRLFLKHAYYNLYLLNVLYKSNFLILNKKLCLLNCFLNSRKTVGIKNNFIKTNFLINYKELNNFSYLLRYKKQNKNIRLFLFFKTLVEVYKLNLSSAKLHLINYNYNFSQESKLNTRLKIYLNLFELNNVYFLNFVNNIGNKLYQYLYNTILKNNEKYFEFIMMYYLLKMQIFFLITKKFSYTLYNSEFLIKKLQLKNKKIFVLSVFDFKF